ncbi:glutathione peroxidase 6-like [Babylonia areolata]|uniref:glutathione peroxidase 6-like n=1 Tax=Babylonia areolata TaxID=304850 RepID=UPI003FD12D33
MEKQQGRHVQALLAVPCDQFGHQEPAANRTELMNGLRHVRPGSGFTPLFNLTARSHVNGANELKLYSYLKSKCPPAAHASFPKGETFWDPIYPSDITWNFEKFLIDDRGFPLVRFLPDVEPLEIDLLLDDLDPKGRDLPLLLARLDEDVRMRVR